jgi:muramidase (phage lysozyme)
MVLIHNKNVSGLSTIQDTVTGIKPEDWEFPSIWEYEVSYWDEGYEGEDEEECDIDTGRGEMTYEECEDCLRAVKEVEDEEGYIEEVECDEYEHPDYDDEDCRCVDYERRRYTVWYNQTRYVEFLTLQPLENTDDSAYTYGYDTWDEVDSDIDYKQTIITKDEEDTDYEEGHYEEYNLEEEGDIIGVDADEYDSSHVKKYMRNLVGWVLGTKDPQENLTEQFDMLSPKEMKKRDLTIQIFNVLNSNFTILPFDDGELDYEGKPMGLYSHQHESFIPLDAIFNPVMDMVEGGIDQEDIEIFVKVITDWINQTMSSPSTLNENVYIQDSDSEYTEEEYADFVNFVNDNLEIENKVDVHIENEPTSDYTTGNYNPKEKKVKVRDNGRKLVDMLRTIAHELVHHRQNELGKINPPVPEIGGEIEDEANSDAGRLVKYYGKMKPEIYEEGKDLKDRIKKVLEEQDWEQFQLDIVKQTPSTKDDEELKSKLDNPPFKNRKEGNVFRKWVNKEFPEIAVELKLDPEGPHDNETIKEAWVFVTDDGKTLGLKWMVMSPRDKDDVKDEFEPIKLDPTSDTSGTQKEKALLQAIIWAEGTLTSNPYIVIYGSEMVPELTSMTADEWLESAKTKKLPLRFGGGVIPYKKDKYNSTATGAFQIMPKTLRGIIKGGILTGEDIMNPKNQDKAAIYLIGPGQAKLKWNDIGNSLTTYQMNQLSRVWASIAHSKGKGGKGNKEGSYYGQGGKSQKAFNEKYQEYLGLQLKDENKKNEIKNELEVEDIISDSNFCAGLQLVKIPGTSNDWRSGQPSRAQLKYIIEELGVKNVIRLNGNSSSDVAARCDKSEKFKVEEEKALVEALGGTFYGSEKYGFLNSHDGFKKGQGYVKTIDNVLPILDKGNTLIHCKNGADRTGYLVAEWLQQNMNWGKEDLWNYATQYNSWEGSGGKVCKGKYGYIKYMEGFYPLYEWCKGSGQPNDRSKCYSCTNIDDIYKNMCKRGC